MDIPPPARKTVFKEENADIPHFYKTIS